MAENPSKLVNELRAKRDAIKELNQEFEAKLQPLKDAEAIVELKLINLLESMGLTQIKNDGFTASVSLQVLPKIEDFDKFQMFVLKNKRCDLFERRVSRNAFKEMIETRKGKPVPGVGIFEKQTIQLRATGD